MLRHWLIVERESSKLATLVNQGTDHDLVRHLESMNPEHLRSVVTHIAKDGDTVLHLAAVRERLDSVRVMLNNKADVNTRDGHGRSPLYQCLCHNSMSSVRLLVSFGADVNETVCRQTRESLLHRMMKGNRQLAADLLLEAGTALETTTKDGDTPLHFAARYNRPKMAMSLTVMGANINATNSKHETPLHVAVASHSLDAAKALVKKKANVTAKDVDGMTALHLAVAASDVELVRLILTSNSTQVNSKEAVLGRTPLLLACSNSSQKIVALLLSHGADINLTTNYRKSVLHVAASSGKAKVFGTVMKHATNPNALATNNKTPLHCAVTEGHTDIVRMLLDARVNVNMRDMDGNTALHMASQAGNNEIVNLLLQHDANVNTTNMLHQTALHMASMAGHKQTGMILIKARCDVEILDIHEAKAQDYLHLFLNKAKRNVDPETKWRVSKVNSCDYSHVHLQDIQEDNAVENDEQSVIANGEILLHEKDTSIMCDMRNDINTYEVLPLVSATSKMTLTNDLPGHHDKTETDLNVDDNINERSSGKSSDDEDDDSADNDCDKEYSKNGKRGSLKRHTSRTRHRKSRKAKTSKRKNSNTGKIKVKRRDELSKHGEGNDDVHRQEGNRQHKRKKGVAVLK